MARTTHRQVEMAALFAVYDMGGKFFTSNKAVRDYVAKSEDPKLKSTLVLDLKEAWKKSAFLVDRPFWGNNRHGWRLNRFCKGSGQSDVTITFYTASAFADALHVVSSIKHELEYR